MARMIGNNAAGPNVRIGPGDTWHYDASADEIVVVSRSGAVQRFDAGMFVQQSVALQQWMPSTSGQASFSGNMAISAQAGAMAGPSFAQALMMPDPKQPDTLGWREWRWSEAANCLQSPSQSTAWPEAELVVPHWDEGEVVRGASGIHAHLVPKHWKILGCHHGEYVPVGDPMRVHGIVERFGKYVLGTEGWRAEWVIIKELMAPSTEVGLKIEKAYPDVIVHYPEDEGDQSCTSAISSKWGKGNRSTSRPKPSPLPSPSPSPNSSQVFQQSTRMLANQPLVQNNQLIQHMLNQQNANSSQPTSTIPSASSSSTRPSRSESSSETEPRRDFVFTFLETGPIWMFGLLAGVFLLWVFG
jgi:hypothetical protein